MESILFISNLTKIITIIKFKILKEMTRITEKSFKHGTVNYLIKVMKEKEIKPKRIEYLESMPTSGEIQSVASDKISHSRVC